VNDTVILVLYLLDMMNEPNPTTRPILSLKRHGNSKPTLSTTGATFTRLLLWMMMLLSGVVILGVVYLGWQMDKERIAGDSSTNERHNRHYSPHSLQVDVDVMISEQNQQHTSSRSMENKTNKNSPKEGDATFDRGWINKKEDATEKERYHPQKYQSSILVPKDYKLPLGFQHVLHRALKKQSFCRDLEPVLSSVENNSSNNNAIPDLPNHGIIQALENYRPHTQQEAQLWNCQLPPTTECNETQLTVIFLGYNPERLDMFRRHVFQMTNPKPLKEAWKGLIREVILVWNGPRELYETETGRIIQEWADDPIKPFRIIYPLKDGFTNDLMNRYHPRMNITTKAILFYDDDGPFYKVPAVTSGFELWKRNANAQIGAMARVLNVQNRQLKEKESYPKYSEHEWIGHCREKGDSVRYNFNYFANFGANMVLPSGSFLHSNYLCFLWHPALEEIRAFVRAHPVHPDDVTVSTIVSHVSGRAPKVYSRRLNLTGWNTTTITKKRRLQDDHRRLLWNDGDIGIWAQKRESSVNSLLSYFGSINSGANGWCYGTPYHVQNKFDVNTTMGQDICDPWIAQGNMLPWMTNDTRPLERCPELREVH